jgi:hypothetical protein
MSKMFGPIHYWLFDQIRLVDHRTETILDHYEQIRSGNEARALREDLDRRFGEAVGKRELEELVFQPNIHQGLSELVRLVEAREAAAVAAFGNEDSLCELYRRHGKETAGKLPGKGHQASGNALHLFEAVQQVKLVGMPCDQVVEVIEANDYCVVWRQQECLQLKNWATSGADAEKLFDLHGHWIAGFARALNPKAQYEKRFFAPAGSPASEEALTISEE